MVGVDSGSQQVQAIFCKNSAQPPTLPPPIVSVLPMRVPVCDPGEERSQLEVSPGLALVRSGIRGRHDNVPSAGKLRAHGGRAEAGGGRLGERKTEEAAGERDTDQDVRRECYLCFFSSLFSSSSSSSPSPQLALKLSVEARALEVARMMPDVETLQYAIRYAAGLRRRALAERLNEMARDMAARGSKSAHSSDSEASSSEESSEEEEAAGELPVVAPLRSGPGATNRSLAPAGAMHLAPKGGSRSMAKKEEKKQEEERKEKMKEKKKERESR